MNSTTRTSAADLYSPDMLERLRGLGKRIRQARIARRLRQVDLAGKTGLSRTTIEAIERGAPATSIGAYLHALWALGLDRELDLIADPGLDREGLALTWSLADKRVRVAEKVDNDF